MSEQQTQAPSASIPETKHKMTKEERIELQNKKREEKKAMKAAKKAARREEFERTTVEITHDEFLKFKEWKRSHPSNCSPLPL